MVLVDYIGICFTFPNTFDRWLYTFSLNIYTFFFYHIEFYFHAYKKITRLLLMIHQKDIEFFLLNS